MPHHFVSEVAFEMLWDVSEEYSGGHIRRHASQKVYCTVTRFDEGDLYYGLDAVGGTECFLQRGHCF